MTIRSPRPDDASTLGRVHVRAWQEGYKGGLMPDDYLAGLSAEERTQMWSDALAREPRDRSGRWVSLEEGGRVVGFILVGPADGEPEATEGEVYALNVDPDFWGRGHGRQLLEAGTDSLRSFGFPEASLWVHAGAERSRRFYERNGWLPDGVERVIEVLGVEVPETRYRRAV